MGGVEAERGNLWLAMAKTLAQVGVFVALMLAGGRRLFPWLLWMVAKTGSRELFTLCVITAAVGVAYASAVLFDVSFALGAFFAGMMMRESEFSHRAAEDSLPLRDAFSVLFFVSVGMLFDPQVLVDEPLKVLAVVVIILVGKTVAAVGLVINGVSAWLFARDSAHDINLRGAFLHLLADAGAKFIEGNFGFAWRPFDSGKWSLIGKYTYLYDLSALDSHDR